MRTPYLAHEDFDELERAERANTPFTYQHFLSSSGGGVWCLDTSRILCGPTAVKHFEGFSDVHSVIRGILLVAMACALPVHRATREASSVFYLGRQHLLVWVIEVVKCS